ncbi:TPA: SAP domain-containing protein [Streptococcus suis]
MGFFDKIKSWLPNNSETSKPTNDDIILQVGDLILLNWFDYSLVDGFPGYFEADYNINPHKHRDILIQKGFLEYQQSPKSLKKLKIVDLKEILKKRDLPISGKKDVLIERIMNNFDILQEYIPNTLCLTELAEKTLEENQIIIKAHNDKHINAFDFCKYLEEIPNASYNEIKSKILNDYILLYYSEQQFMSLANTYNDIAEFYSENNNYEQSVFFYLKSLLMHASGLHNQYSYINKPIYYPPLLNPYKTNELRNQCQQISIDKFNQLFDKAEADIKNFRVNIFLKKKDFQFLKDNLLTEDLNICEQYLKKFDK